MTTDADRYATAVHEAGHCAAYLHFGLRCGDIRLYQAADGAVSGKVHSPAGTYNCLQYAVCCLSGPSAEARLTGIRLADQTGSHRDIVMALNALARAGTGPVSIDSLLPVADRVVEQEWPRIQVVADTLMQRRRLTYDEVMALCRPRGWRMPPFPAPGGRRLGTMRPPRR